MKTAIIKPQGVCSRQMNISYEDGIIVEASVIGGCAGNLQGICRLIEGMPIDKVIAKLEGVRCRGNTSCPDQLARGLKQLIK